MTRPSPPIDLRDGRLRLRTARPDDVAALVDLWSEPAVVRRWPGEDADSIRRLVTADPDIIPLVVEVEGVVGGFLQIWEETDPEYRHAGIDLFLATRFQGQGLGPAGIRLACRWLFDHGYHRITIDPAADNHRARRAYEKVGFREVGRLRRYQWDATLGHWVDGVLYDLLEEDLS